MLKSKKQLRKLSLVSLVTAFSVSIIGCSAGSGGGTAPQGDKQPTATSNEPFRITMMNQSVLAEPPRPDDPIIKAIEKHTNTKLEIQWVPGSTYDEKLNATVASGGLPMVILVNNKPMPIINAIRAGHFWEIGSYLKDYPNLERAMNKDVLRNTAVDGKNYYMFRSRSLIGDGMIYRTDWLEALGLKPPTTVDELYNVIKAYTLNDPDKNGKNDTLGIGEEMSIRGFKFIMAAYGGGNEYDIKDGKLIPTAFSKEYMDTMNFYRKLYQEKLINLDFAITTRVKNIDNVNKGLYGLRLGDPDFITRHSELFKINPKAELDVSSTLSGPKGTKVLMDNGWSGAFLIPKQSVKSEAELRKILAYFDKLSDETGQNIFEWGIQGVHYSVDNGKAKRTPEQDTKYASEVIHLQQALQVADGSRAMPGEFDKYTTKYKAAKKAVEKNLVINPAAAYITPTLVSKGSELNKIITDGRVKYIMGELDEKGWKDILDKWTKAGGDKVIEELSQEYAKDTNKK
ncbi:extracellular solute-binding protein [Paenibacillus sp. LMG 31456]|uniref:Extracellular solute-binding protein n=1 Tax=Paenibacillus foliorum TaxID=2654974 RepID=A0A972K107_9BACL|nr:extracellular solute-binding protein [Paenibacillus foliorum]NOU92257.1 extracellular solute-binding protein [Paenibacillus foliorum]